MMGAMLPDDAEAATRARNHRHLTRRYGAVTETRVTQTPTEQPAAAAAQAAAAAGGPAAAAAAATTGTQDTYSGRSMAPRPTYQTREPASSD